MNTVAFLPGGGQRAGIFLPSPRAPFPPFCERLPGAGTSAATHFQLTPLQAGRAAACRVGSPPVGAWTPRGIPPLGGWRNGGSHDR